jgi:hypothetical protein
MPTSNMTDRELLELAAKAAGIEIPDGCEFIAPDYWKHQDSNTHIIWNPLGDDGDALRLAVSLRFWVKDFAPTDSDGLDGEYPSFGMVEIWRETDDDPIYVEWYKPGEDRFMVTRRAIVRAAACIGKRMK